jgi:general secretion pathway protein G
MTPSRSNQRGFTIVELLIVIVVIGILAAITIIAYNGVTKRANDTQRKSDVKSIAKALELYYIDNNRYPAGSGSTTINASWSTTADASWQNLATSLRPYLSTLPSDPISSPGVAVTGASGYNYAYYANTNTFCGAAVGKMYILVYRIENGSQENYLEGDCTTNPLIYSASNYRIVRN